MGRCSGERNCKNVMLTKITISNFKRMDSAQIDLGSPVVFIGPNNSGKTTALQALALWETGLKAYIEKRSEGSTAKKRVGVTINRRDLVASPVPTTQLLWRGQHVREQVLDEQGKRLTRNIRVDIIVEGVDGAVPWSCGLEFDYANDESIYCRPLRSNEGDSGPRMEVPDEASKVLVSFLPPMSGLATKERRQERGAINALLGEGRTAEVLRSLCYLVYSEGRQDAAGGNWKKIASRMKSMFGISLAEPEYFPRTSEVSLAYNDQDGNTLDISCAGRGLQQTLLLLAHLAANPKTVLLLDEPDAHLEILRQRQIYNVLCEAAREQGSQLIIASHSEIVLNEAAGKDVVVAFVGKPHRIDDRGSQLLKSLIAIGFDQFIQAEQTGWVLYLEGSTDLAILRSLAGVLGLEKARQALSRPFVHYVLNQPNLVADHFYGLREAKADLLGFALFDQYGKSPSIQPPIEVHQWKRRELENYIASRQTLLAWTKRKCAEHLGPIFEDQWTTAMEQAIQELEQALKVTGKPSPWGPQIKASDDFLDPLFANFFSKLSLPNLMNKSNYHELAACLTAPEVDPEVIDVLRTIENVAARARPIG